MRFHPILGGTVALALFTSALAFAPPASAQGGKGGKDSGAAYGWLSDYSQAKAQAQKTGKPIMLVFRCVP